MTQYDEGYKIYITKETWFSSK